MPRILFLDFDGVLHPGRGQGARFSRMELLAAFLRESAHADVCIVISSTWREVYSLSQLRNFFALDLRERIIDVTPVRDEWHSEDYRRGEEIEAWLTAQAVRPPWVAVDDDREGFSARLHKHVAFTESDTGLSVAALDVLRGLLLQATLKR